MACSTFLSLAFAILNLILVAKVCANVDSILVPH